MLLQSLPRAARGGIAVSRCAPMEGGGREGGTWCECAARLVPILTGKQQSGKPSTFERGEVVEERVVVVRVVVVRVEGEMVAVKRVVLLRVVVERVEGETVVVVRVVERKVVERIM